MQNIPPSSRGWLWGGRTGAVNHSERQQAASSLGENIGDAAALMVWYNSILAYFQEAQGKVHTWFSPSSLSLWHSPVEFLKQCFFRKSRRRKPIQDWPCFLYKTKPETKQIKALNKMAAVLLVQPILFEIVGSKLPMEDYIVLKVAKWQLPKFRVTLYQHPPAWS